MKFQMKPIFEVGKKDMDIINCVYNTICDLIDSTDCDENCISCPFVNIDNGFCMFSELDNLTYDIKERMKEIYKEGK